MSLYMHGLGHYHPENEISNAFLEALEIGTNDTWIRERVGIRSRRTVLPLDHIRETRNASPWRALDVAVLSNAAMAERAARMAIARAGIATRDIGMVIAGSSASDTTAPAEACNIARLLELEVPAFDVNSACTSFFAAVYLLSRIRSNEMPDYVLVAVSEALTKTVNYNDRASAVLWGDCAVAAVLSTRHPGRAEILSSSLTSSPAGNTKVVVPRIGHFTQDGPSVHKFAIRETVNGLRELQRVYTCERRFGFVGHQANLRMLEAVCRQCDIPLARHYTNVEHFGNTAAAGSASVLSMHWNDFDATDDVAVVGVGSGLSWGGYMLRFCGPAITPA